MVIPTTLRASPGVNAGDTSPSNCRIAKVFDSDVRIPDDGVHMTADTGKYADFEGVREQAVALRREGLSLRQIRDRLRIYNNGLLHRPVKGEPAPEWTKRPNAKDDLRDRARELRLQGMTYDQIQVELGCSKSSISLWSGICRKSTTEPLPSKAGKPH